MVKGNGKFDFNKLVKFPMPSRANHASKIKVDLKGEVYFSKSIIDGVRRDNEGMKVDFRHSEDYRTIAIKPEQEGDFRIPKAGTMKYKEWKDAMQNFGYLLPAIYCGEWNKEQEIWIGVLQEVSEAPEV